MKKTEKIIASILIMALGVLFILLKDAFISLLMTLLGVGLIVFGIIDIVHKLVPPAVVKIVSGVLVIVCGWALVEAVLYILSGALLVFGILLLYQKVKLRVCGVDFLRTVLEYATPVIAILIGVLLLFHHAAFVNFVFIFSGVLLLLEGGVLLFEGLTEE